MASSSSSSLCLHSLPKASSGLNQWRGRLRFEFRGSSAFLSPAVVFLQQSPRLSAIRASSEGSSRRRGYNESQAVSGFSNAKVQQIASNVLPVGSFVVVTFVLWKVVEKFMSPKSPKTSSAGDSKSSTEGVKWSIGAGTNLLQGFAAKVDRENKQRLNEFAKELRSFRSVDMSGCNFGDEGLFFLAESLGYNQTVEEVSFSANGITAAGVKAFDGVLQSNIMLKVLNLSGNPIGDEGAKTLCATLMENSSIEILQLNSTDLGDEGAKEIAELLKRNSTLRVIELNNNMIDYSGFTSLAGALPENNTIRNLHLNGNYGGALGANALSKGLEGNKSLRELHLHGNSIGDEGIRALMAGLSSHKGKLALLDLGNNSITAKGAFYVAEYIKRSKCLVWLNLYMNDIGDEGAEKVADALKQNRSIATIDIGGNNIHAEGVNAIAQALKDNAIITTLEVGYNPIGPDGAKALSEILKFHGNVKTLKLGWCQIAAKGAEYVADMLRYNNTISVLDLRANGLRDEGASCLARSLKVVNEALTSVDLGFNEIRDDGAFSIAQALKANEDVTVTSINLGNNFITKFGQSALTDARDHNRSRRSDLIRLIETRVTPALNGTVVHIICRSVLLGTRSKFARRGRNRSPSPDRDGMFAGMVVFMVDTGVQRRRLQIWKQKLVQMGGAVIEEGSLTKKVTHVLAMTPEALVGKFQKEPLSRFKGRLLRYQWLEDSLTSGEKANEDLYLLKFEEPNKKSLPARSGSEDQPSTPKRAKDSPDSSDTVGLDTQNNTQGSPTSCIVPSTSPSPGEGNAETPTTSPQSEPTSVYKPPDLNRNITEIFGKLINIYRALGDDRRSFSYYKAIPVIEKFPTKIESVDQLKHLPGIGKSLTDHIQEIVTTGKLSKLEHFETDEKVRTISLFGEVWGIGPATALKLYEKGHRTLDDLKNEDSLTHAQRLGLKYFDDIRTRIPRQEVYPRDIHAFGLIAWTGNDVLNRRLRLLAESKGYRLDDTGLFPATHSSSGNRGGKASASMKLSTEKQVFDFLGFPWLEPHERNL
ncbi:hypothetical protein HID58_031037 [Brassica napus]|uniref:DNA polymerase lambda n=1 Tax=Brassica napus TaxID=3708 RepID=A0ABQ8CHM0_BRANA|nr:hypothetical protein HID58_031037 [Brassica napus]